MMEAITTKQKNFIESLKEKVKNLNVKTVEKIIAKYPCDNEVLKYKK